MNDDLVIGLVSAAVPLLIIGFLALRRLPAVFAFFIAVLAVGLGYLTTTGAVQDIGGKVREHLPAGILPASKPVKVDAMAPAKPVEAPAMAPMAPATPAPTPAPAPMSPAATPAPAPAPATP